LIAKDLAEQRVNYGMQSLLTETVAVLFRLPHVDVAKTSLGSFDGDMADETLRRIVTEAIGDALIEGGVDRNVLGESVGHAYSS
jgi:hypothetical protein